MIEQQLGFSLESFLRGIVGISTVLGVAYLMSYDRKRVDWKLVGGGLFMQFVFALADRKSTRLNSSHMPKSRMPSSA